MEIPYTKIPYNVEQIGSSVDNGCSGTITNDNRKAKKSTGYFGFLRETKI